MMSTRRVGWLLAGALAGCDPGPPAQVDASSPRIACRRTFDRMRACASPDARQSLDEYGDLQIDDCETEQLSRPEDYRAMSACAERAGCDEFSACMTTVDRRIALRSEMVFIIKTLRNRSAWRIPFGGPDDAIESCVRLYAEDAELAALCDDLYAQVVVEFRSELVDLRDTDLARGRGRCDVLREKAARIPAPAGEELRVVCEEIAAGLAADETRSNVVIARAYELEDVPASCAATIERLDRIGTPWAKSRREGVVTDCYVEFGASLLPRMIAGKRCEDIAEMVGHLAPRASEDKSLAKLLGRVEKACPALKLEAK